MIHLVDKTFSVAQIIEPAWKRNYKFVEHCAFSQFGFVFFVTWSVIVRLLGQLSVMSVEMAAISVWDINCAMVEFQRELFLKL